VEGREVSVHLARFPTPSEIFSEEPTKLLDEWKKLFEVRDAVLRKLEVERQAKTIGKGLEADVQIEAGGEALSLLERYAASLKEFFNVSNVRVTEYEVKDSPIATREFEVILPTIGGHVEIRSVSAAGSKCARCWNFMPEVSNYGIWQNVCTRCQGALTEMGIERPQPESTEIAS
jgi:isoleucyl-tRNA synthetase